MPFTESSSEMPVGDQVDGPIKFEVQEQGEAAETRGPGVAFAPPIRYSGYAFCAL